MLFFSCILFKNNKNKNNMMFGICRIFINNNNNNVKLSANLKWLKYIVVHNKIIIIIYLHTTVSVIKTVIKYLRVEIHSVLYNRFWPFVCKAVTSLFSISHLFCINMYLCNIDTYTYLHCWKEKKCVYTHIGKLILCLVISMGIFAIVYFVD